MTRHARSDAFRRIFACSALFVASSTAIAEAPAVTEVLATDASGDAGGRVQVTWIATGDQPSKWLVERFLSADAAKSELRSQRVAAAGDVVRKTLEAETKRRGLATPDAEAWRVATEAAGAAAAEIADATQGLWISAVKVDGAEGEAIADGVPNGKPSRFRVSPIADDGSRGAAVEAANSASPMANPWFTHRTWFFAILMALCATILISIMLARGGRPAKIRHIAGLDAVDEAIGRATEMGRPVLFIPGIQDMDNVQTVAGVTVLARVAKIAAEYDARIEVPTARSLVMTACRDAVEGAYLAAGRSDAYNPDLINYITDEQFGYVAWVAGRMRREKPATCIYMGQFYAESLLLAENGNEIGAIQIAGTAETSQLPFFVAACDYTLIGEEFFAASAYLSGEQTQLGSLRGQDIGKALTAVILIVGILLATIAPWSDGAKTAANYLRDVVLKG